MADQDNTVVKNQLTQTINSKTKEVGDCKSIVTKLCAQKTKLEAQCKKWEIQYRKHENSQIASQVVVKNVFEGTVADKLKERYGGQVKNMQKTVKEVGKLCKELESQIQKLNAYISGLQSDINTAKTQLSNMED